MQFMAFCKIKCDFLQHEKPHFTLRQVNILIINDLRTVVFKTKSNHLFS